MSNATRTLDEDALVASIGPQFRTPRGTEITIHGKRVHLDYQTLEPVTEIPGREPILPLTGFGSGWRGIAELGFHLATHNWPVIMMSQPGYGNSEDPPATYFNEAESFEEEAEALHQFIERIRGAWLDINQLHFVGHSMSAATITYLAANYPADVASLTLLNPAGFEEVNLFALAARFGLNGLQHSLAHRGPSVWRKLQPHLPKEQNPFKTKRLRQRFSEWCRSSGDLASEVLEVVDRRIPIAYVTGDHDYVFPASKSAILKHNLLAGRRSRKFHLSSFHNTTIGSKPTADAIHEFLSGL